MTKLFLVIAFVMGSSNAWGEDVIYFDGSTVTTLTNWTSSEIGYAWNKSYMYISSTGSISSNSSITLAPNRKLTIKAMRYLSSSEDPSLIIKYNSDNGSTWYTAKTYTTELEVNDYATFELNLTGNYYIKFECNKVRFQTLKLTVSDPYPAPKNFSISSFTKNSAKLTWEKGNDEEAFQLQYIVSGESDSTTVNLGNVTTTTLDDLTTSTEYKAKLRSNYGDSHFSAWTDEISFTPTNEVVKTLFNGTVTSYNLPISSANVGNSTDLTQTQFIIPKDSLTFMKNRQITKIKFYASRTSVGWGNAEFEVYLKETDGIAYNSSTKEFESWGTKVYNQAKLSTDATKGEMTIILNTPFNYKGNNLMVGFKQKVKGTSPSSTYWYSINTSPIANNRGIYHYGSYNGVISYLPKITITSVAMATEPVQMDATGFATFASPQKLDLTASKQTELGLTAYRATINEETKKVKMFEINQNVAANNGMLLQGTANQTYFIPIAESGTDIADNAFLVNTDGITPDDDYYYFGMKKNSDPLLFAQFDPSTVTIPSNKAYLMVEKRLLDDSDARVLSCVFEEAAPTGISTMTNSRSTSHSYFDLQGRKVTSPTKGLYIVNGKKFVVK